MSDLVTYLTAYGDTVADRLDLYARWQAVEAHAKRQQQRLRDRFNQDADALEAATGGAANVPVGGVGRVLRTDPQPNVKVTDPHAFAEWLTHAGWQVRWRQTVTVTDTTSAAVALERLHDLFAPGQNADDGDVYNAAYDLSESLCLDPQPLLPDLDDVLADGVVQVAGGAAVDVETGELVPGLTVSVSPRRLQVRVDTGHRDALAGQLDRLIGGDA